MKKYWSLAVKVPLTSEYVTFEKITSVKYTNISAAPYQIFFFMMFLITIVIFELKILFAIYLYILFKIQSIDF